jgi:MSHA biogenesis protein MshP
MNARSQSGSALVIALFLVVVVAALGVFAVRIGGAQQQTATLQLLGYQAEAAANAGLEVWANRLANALPPALPPACPVIGNPAPLIPIGNYPGTGLNGYVVRLEACQLIVSGTGLNQRGVYDIAVSASRGNFGDPDFVRRQLSRRMSNIGLGSYR